MSIRIHLFGNLRFTCDDVPVTTIGTNRLQSLLATSYPACGNAAVAGRTRVAAFRRVGREPGAHEPAPVAASSPASSAASCSLLISDNHTLQWPRDPQCIVDADDFEQAVERAAEAAKTHDASSFRASSAEKRPPPSVRTNWLAGSTMTGSHPCGEIPAAVCICSRTPRRLV